MEALYDDFLGRLHRHREEGGTLPEFWEKEYTPETRPTDDFVHAALNHEKNRDTERSFLEELGHERPSVQLSEQSFKDSRHNLEAALVRSDLSREEREAAMDRIDQLLRQGMEERNPKALYETLQEAASVVNDTLSLDKRDRAFLEVSHDKPMHAHASTHAEELLERARLNKAEAGAKENPEVEQLVKEGKVMEKVENSNPQLTEIDLTIMPMARHRGAGEPSFHGVEARETTAMKDLLEAEFPGIREELKGKRHDEVETIFDEKYHPDDPDRGLRDVEERVRKRYQKDP